jgi:hypothetical protein
VIDLGDGYHHRRTARPATVERFDLLASHGVRGPSIQDRLALVEYSRDRVPRSTVDALRRRVEPWKYLYRTLASSGV